MSAGWVVSGTTRPFAATILATLDTHRPVPVGCTTTRAPTSWSTEDTPSRCGGFVPSWAHAPTPFAAHHRIPVAGLDATPTVITPCSSNAISVPHAGDPAA